MVQAVAAVSFEERKREKFRWDGEVWGVKVNSSRVGGRYLFGIQKGGGIISLQAVEPFDSSWKRAREGGGSSCQILGNSNA